MKFTVPVSCSCGFDFKAAGYGERTFPPATCPNCGVQIRIIDPLTISIVADRLLHRSQIELNGGDFTLPIILSAMAIETTLVRVFLKWKEIEHNLIGPQATDANRAAWRKEFRQGVGTGGFKKAVNFVSQSIRGKLFDDFVADFLKRAKQVDLVKAGLMATTKADDLKTAHIYSELYTRRNHIIHAGKVDHTKEDAQKAFNAALHAFSMLRVMDREKADALDKHLKASLQ